MNEFKYHLAPFFSLSLSLARIVFSLRLAVFSFFLSIPAVSFTNLVLLPILTEEAASSWLTVPVFSKEVANLSNC